MLELLFDDTDSDELELLLRDSEDTELLDELLYDDIDVLLLELLDDWLESELTLETDDLELQDEDVL